VKSEKVKNSAHLRVRNFLARVDKKDANLKMAKLLIYQGCSALFELFFKVFSSFDGYL
jgi:hypothetical protein